TLSCSSFDFDAMLKSDIEIPSAVEGILYHGLAYCAALRTCQVLFTFDTCLFKCLDQASGVFSPPRKYI
ncbi:hypothetical protein M8369_36440, partial [Klebsiella pneumoniae]|nr:hypothetical protein [Klebsiella pneumoniae]